MGSTCALCQNNFWTQIPWALAWTFQLSNEAELTVLIRKLPLMWMIVNQEEQLMCRQAGAVIQRDLDRQVPDIGAHGLMRPCEVWPRQSTVSQLCWSSPMHKKSPENHWVEVRGSQWTADWAWAYIKHSLQAKDTNHSLPLGAGVMRGPVLASQENKATGSSLVGQSMALSSALPSAKRAILLLSSRCEPHHFSSFFFFTWCHMAWNIPSASLGQLCWFSPYPSPPLAG